jgi:hypothetical protein
MRRTASRVFSTFPRTSSLTGLPAASSSSASGATSELATLMPFHARGTPCASVSTIGKLRPEMTSPTMPESVVSVVAG